MPRVWSSTSQGARRWGIGIGVLLTCCVCTGPVGEGPCTRAGALLPFTGELSSAATSIERALILAAESVNAAGGLGGEPLCIDARDTRDSIKDGLQAARDLVYYDKVQVLLGPQDDELALQVVDLLRERRVLGLSGGTTSPALSYANDGGLWFRTVPSAAVLGRALAERIFSDGVRTISVLYEASEFGVGWTNVLQSHFTVLGGRSAGIHSYQPGQRTYADQIAAAFAPGVEAVVLVASAATGAAIVEEWATSGHGRRWYFASSLDDPLFVENVPPGSVEGMVGVAPALGVDAGRLDALFAARWQGEIPLRTAYFYHDALLLWALAHEEARVKTGGWPEAGEVADCLQKVSAPPGESVVFDELDRALELVHQSQDLDFVGATGAVDLDPRGDVATASAQFWSVGQGRIVYE
ncbi:MAG: ABC transporter substrate-binding protein [Pseudomonadota bacterium]